MRRDLLPLPLPEEQHHDCDPHHSFHFPFLSLPSQHNIEETSPLPPLISNALLRSPILPFDVSSVLLSRVSVLANGDCAVASSMRAVGVLPPAKGNAKRV